MARTSKAAQKKNKAKMQPQKASDKPADLPLGDVDNAMDIAHAETVDAEAEHGGEEEEAQEKISLGKLKKKQRWEQKLLKVKVGNLKKERLKLGKKNPVHKADRKALTKQMKMMLEEQQKAHAEQLKQGLESP